MNATDTDDKGLLSKINGKAVFRYAVKPDIMPRLRSLGMHFGHFAYLIALVLNSARLIPQHHQVLNAVNIGKFSVRQVLAIAANNITWSWKNIDQIAIFGAVTIGLIMVVIQAVVIAAYAFLGTAQAASPSSTTFFSTPAENVQTDVALIMLEQVFGPNLDFFGTASQPLGSPVYEGLQAILGFYSMAMMVVAVIIVLYYIMTVIGEAAKSGTPFGQRFNSLWAPIRLVIALGLLVPLGSGLNSAQYITLQIAKMGSGLGTMVWSTFVGEFTEAKNIVTAPQSESTIQLVRRVFLNEVCAASFNQVERNNGRKITILQKLGNTSAEAKFDFWPDMLSGAYLHGETTVDFSWSTANAKDEADDYTCGQVEVSLTEFDLHTEGRLIDPDEELGFWDWLFGNEDLVGKIGKVHEDIKVAYVKEIGRISEAVKPAAEAVAEAIITVNAGPALGDMSSLDFIPDLLRGIAVQTSKNVNMVVVTSFESLTTSAYSANGSAAEEMEKRGWGAAGLWYANIGKINHKFNEAISSAAPTLGILYDADDVTENERGGLGWFFGLSRFGTSGSSTTEIEESIIYANEHFAEHIASGVPQNSTLYQDARNEAANDDANSGLARFIFRIFGAKEVYDLKTNPNLDPMTRMVSAGHDMVGGSLVWFGLGAASKGVSFIAGMRKSKGIADFFSSAASLMFAIAVVGFTAGVFLAYVLPLLPFIYFSFAVIGWVLEIFEAIVAMPLWALAHLRIDGEGMPGDAAIQGYHLLLMILLRPALIVIGLIGGYVIFGAAMYYFITLFNSAVSVTRSEYIGDTTGAIGVFIYTIIFVFLAYNIALMCFKMVDDVPKGIMRWMGSSAQPFGDSRGDPINGAREAIIGSVAGAAKLSSGLSRGLTGEGDPTGQSRGILGSGAQGAKIAGSSVAGRMKGTASPPKSKPKP